VAGIDSQLFLDRRFQAGAGAREATLRTAVARAERGNLRTKEGRAELDEAQKALQEFNTAVLESKASIAEQTRARAQAVTDEARAAVLSGSDVLNRDLARAGLTTSTADDLDVLGKQKVIAERAIADAQARNDISFETEQLGVLKGINDNITGLREEAAAQAKESLEAQLAAEKERSRKLEAELRNSRAQDSVGLTRALARPQPTRAAFPNRTPFIG
jgi:hypothetical protein